MGNSGKTEWFDNDAFWEETGALMFGAQRQAQTPGEVDNLIVRLELEPGARLLDLGCGPGRHSLEFARRGYRVTGVDRTAAYLKMAREQAEREGLSVEFVQADMREFCRPNEFDAAINMYTAFGYFEDPEDDVRVASQVARSLCPGGGFLIDTHGKESLARIYRDKTWKEESGTLWLEEARPADDWARNEVRWVVVKDGQRRDFGFSVRLYAASEMKTLLKSAGFTSVQVFGDLAGGPYDHTAKRLIAVGRTG